MAKSYIEKIFHNYVKILSLNFKNYLIQFSKGFLPFCSTENWSCYKKLREITHHSHVQKLVC